jgi:hypothetical protein
MVESKSDEFFPKIGEVAGKTDALGDKDTPDQTEEHDDEDRAVEEIESLCMNCGEQVRGRVDLGSSFAECFGWLVVGRYEAAVDDDSVLQGGYYHVVQVRILWDLEQRNSIRGIHTTCVCSAERSR